MSHVYPRSDAPKAFTVTVPPRRSGAASEEHLAATKLHIKEVRDAVKAGVDPGVIRKSLPTYRQDPIEVVAARVIAAREKGLDWRHAAHEIIAGAHDVEGAKAAWDAVEAEVVNLSGISLTAYETKTLYMTALNATARFLDPVRWYAGVLLKHGVVNWAAIQAKLAADVA